jgi:hypothetical protein
MTNIFTIDMNVAKLLQDSFGGRPNQEKTDRVLEPLQAMIQLALLSYCPLGTKLCVNNNILSLQLPAFSQGVWRWFNKDSKDDLYFLFNAVKRYYMWYRGEDNRVFDQIMDLAKLGISRLIETYKQTEKTSIIHTLSLYRSILEMNSLENIFGTKQDESSTTMNTIFQRSKELYDDELLLVVSNVFKLMEKEKKETFRNQYYEGLQLFLMPLNQKIRQWIHNELLCT